MKSEITSYISGHSYCATFKIENTKGEITLAPLLWNNPQIYLLYNASLLNNWGRKVLCRGKPLMLPNLILNWRFLNKPLWLCYPGLKGPSLLSSSCACLNPAAWLGKQMVSAQYYFSKHSYPLSCCFLWSAGLLLSLFFLFASLSLSLSHCPSLFLLTIWGQRSLKEESSAVLI